MKLDVEALLQPISETEPAGVDLSYDPAFRALQRMLDEAADKERPSDDAGMKDAIDQSVALLQRSKDLWIASNGVYFGVYLGDLEAAGGFLEVLAGIPERFWETCFPALEDGVDARRAACSQIASIGRMVRHLERLYLAPLRSKGRISFKDIAGAAGPEVKAAEIFKLCPEQIRRAIDETGPEDWVTLSGELATMLAASARLSVAFSDKSMGQTPELAVFDAAVRRMKEFVDIIVARKMPETAAEGATGEGDAAGGTTGRPAISGPIATREQALAVLDQVKDFFLQTEPTNPVPFLIDRIKRLIGMNFIQILENLAPDGIDQAAKILQPPLPETPPEE